MKKLFLTTAMLFMANYMFATIRLVDQNGGGSYLTISAGIAAANANDTVRVWPGTYNEQVTLSKNILLEGSGYENCIITGNFSPTIIMTVGTIKWFMISSFAGDGINISGGTVKNCVIKGCSACGVRAISGTSSIQNCTVVNNGSFGIYCNGHNGETINVTNCISYSNSSDGFAIDCGYASTMQLSYSNGYANCTVGNQGVIDLDPNFTSSSDYHITGPPCMNTGNPSLSDPDGSISDMGYFGGPDCPIYPVVYELQITPNGSNINIQTKGRANY